MKRYEKPRVFLQTSFCSVPPLWSVDCLFEGHIILLVNSVSSFDMVKSEMNRCLLYYNYLNEGILL